MIVGRIVALAIAVFIATTPAFAQLGQKDGAGMAATDLDRIKVGQVAPDFALTNMDGKQISLSEFRGKKSVVLVFYRGHW